MVNPLRKKEHSLSKKKPIEFLLDFLEYITLVVFFFFMMFYYHDDDTYPITFFRCICFHLFITTLPGCQSLVTKEIYNRSWKENHRSQSSTDINCTIAWLNHQLANLVNKSVPLKSFICHFHLARGEPLSFFVFFFTIINTLTEPHMIGPLTKLSPFFPPEFFLK